MQEPKRHGFAASEVNPGEARLPAIFARRSNLDLSSASPGFKKNLMALAMANLRQASRKRQREFRSHLENEKVMHDFRNVQNESSSCLASLRWKHQNMRSKIVSFNNTERSKLSFIDPHFAIEQGKLQFSLLSVFAQHRSGASLPRIRHAPTCCLSSRPLDHSTWMLW